jgi:hypothetical protein
LPKHKALGLIPRTTKKSEERREKEGRRRKGRVREGRRGEIGKMKNKISCHFTIYHYFCVSEFCS